MPKLFAITALIGAFLFGPLAHSQAKKDPLNDEEVDQIREVADRPPERVKLYLKFIEQRVAAIKQMSSDPEVQNRPAKLRGLMEEFTRLADELQDNLDNYEDTHADIRKPLKELTSASAKWPDILKTAPADRSYEFARKTALEAAQSANDQATKLLEAQTKYFAEHKKKHNPEDETSKDR